MSGAMGAEKLASALDWDRTVSAKDIKDVEAILRGHKVSLRLLTEKQRAQFERGKAKADAEIAELTPGWCRGWMTLQKQPSSYHYGPERNPHYHLSVYKFTALLEHMRGIRAGYIEVRRREAQIVYDPDPPRQGWVYFIEAGGYIKIGFTGSVPSRLAQIETATPFVLTLLRQEPGTLETEMAFHKRFGALHVKGEWFRFEGELREYLEGNSQ